MARLHDDELDVDEELVRRLLGTLSEAYDELPLHRFDASGSTNALFRLGDELLVRVPRQPGGSGDDREGAALAALRRLRRCRWRCPRSSRSVSRASATRRSGRSCASSPASGPAYRGRGRRRGTARERSCRGRGDSGRARRPSRGSRRPRVGVVPRPPLGHHGRRHAGVPPRLRSRWSDIPTSASTSTRSRRPGHASCNCPRPIGRSYHGGTTGTSMPRTSSSATDGWSRCSTSAVWRSATRPSTSPSPGSSSTAHGSEHLPRGTGRRRGHLAARLRLGAGAVGDGAAVLLGHDARPLPAEPARGTRGARGPQREFAQTRKMSTTMKTSRPRTAQR